MACASGLLKLVVVRNIEKGDGPGNDDEVLDVDGHGEGQQGDDRNHGNQGATCLRSNAKCGVRVQEGGEGQASAVCTNVNRLNQSSLVT